MSKYIDGFVFPIRKEDLEAYKIVVEKIVDIWKEHGALSYNEFILEDPQLEGTLPFANCIHPKEDETIIFGWVTFQSREARDKANKLISADSRMTALMEPLTNSKRLIFDPSRMAYGGFQPFIES